MSANVNWEDHPGEGVTVHAPRGSHAATQAEEELRRAERALTALAELLNVPEERRGPSLDVYLVDPVAGSRTAPVGERGIVRVLEAEASAEPIAAAITRFLAGRWFGPASASATPFVDGLAGVVAGRAGSGDGAEAADAWVRAELSAGRTVSLAPRGEDAAGEPAATDEGLPEQRATAPEAAPEQPAPAGGPPGEVSTGGLPPGAVLGPEMAMGPEMEMPGPGVGPMGGPPPPGAPVPASTIPPDRVAKLAATSFVGHLITEHGGESIRRLLEQYDPARRDHAVVAVFQQPLGALEEAWLASLRGSERKQTMRAFLGYIGPLFKPYWWRQAEVLIYMVVGALFAIISMPVAIGAVVGALAPGTAAPEGEEAGGFLAGIIQDVQAWLQSGDVLRNLLTFILILFLIYAAESLIGMRRSVVSEGIAQRLLISLQEGMFAHLQRLPHDFYASANVGDIMSRLSGDLQGVSTAMTGILNAGLYLVISLGTAIAGVVTLDLRLGALTLVVAPIFIISYKVLGARLAKASYDRMVKTGEAAAITQENLSAHAVVKAYGLEQRAMGAYHSRLIGMLSSSLRMVRISSLYDAASDLAVTLGQLIVLAYGGYLVIDGQMNVAILVAFLGLLPALLLPLTGFSDIGQMVQMAAGSLARVTELLDQPIPIADTPGAKPLPPLEREIRLDHVTFGYDAGRPILRDFDLAIPAGTNVAIVGPSGSGKSTVINLLMRFWDPQEGRVVFDGQDIRDVTLSSLRGQIGLVFQDTFVFDTTVRENIAIGRLGASDAEVEAAAQAARLDEYIASLPAGYDTVLGERGVRMSGGQRQRLAIARALLRDPRILILDEATSALDAKTEAEILETLAVVSQGRTTVTITHRLSLAAAADRVFALEAGRLVEEGTHAELATAGGLYQRLWEQQTGRATSEAAGPGEHAEERLSAIPLFRALDGDALAAVAEQLTPERFARGQDVVRQGEPGDKLYFIGAGRVEVRVSDEWGDRAVDTLEEGDYFGEMALLSGNPRNATVRATAPTELYSLTQRDFQDLLDRYAEIRRAVSETVERRNAALEAAVASAGADPSTGASGGVVSE